MNKLIYITITLALASYALSSVNPLENLVFLANETPVTESTLPVYTDALIKGFLDGLQLFPDLKETNDCKYTQIIEVLKTPITELIDELQGDFKLPTVQDLAQKFSYVPIRLMMNHGPCVLVFQKMVNDFIKAGDIISGGRAQFSWRRPSPAESIKYRQAGEEAKKLLQNGQYEDAGRKFGQIIHDLFLH
jgi:hypothetical protein